MRLAILHAPGEEGLVARVRAEGGFHDALTAPLGSRLTFGEHLVVLVVWTERALGLEEALRTLVRDHRALVVWRLSGAIPSAFDTQVTVLGPDSTTSSLAPALRLTEIERNRPVEPPARRRSVSRGVTAAVVGAAIVAAVGAAGAAAVIMEREAPSTVFAAQPQPNADSSSDLRPTSQP
jgi:hypothetical protein